MALPVTITGLSATHRVVGPFKSSGGNYYIFGQDGTTATTLQAFKATAPDTSWSSIATKTGFANDILGLAGVQNGDVIHMVVNDVTTAGTSWNYKYQTFDMSSDTFVTAETIVSGINPKDSGAGVYGLCEIVFRPSDSQPIVLYPGPQVSTRSKANYKRRTGVATWSSAVVVDAAAASTDYYPVGIALGASSTVHFLTMSSAGTTAERALTSANALQTAVAMPATYAANGSGKGASLVNGATTKVVFANTNGSTSNGVAGYFDSASVPTINTSGAIGASAAMNAGARVYTDGTDFWTLYSRSDNGDAYVSKSTDSGATWGAETLAMAATAAASGPNADEFFSFGATTYTRGTNVVIPYIINDGGTLKYNEYVVRVLAAVGSSAGLSTPLGVGVTLAPGAGSSAGLSTPLGASLATSVAAGASAGVSTPLGSGRATSIAAGASAGASTPLGVGVEQSIAVGASAGTSTATGAGLATSIGAGSSAGVGAAAGIGLDSEISPGTAAGTGTSTGVGQTLAPGLGAAAGLSSPTGASSAMAAGVGLAAGTGTAGGAVAALAVGAAAGVSTPTGVSRETSSADGAASGTGTAAGVAMGTPSAGLAAGTGAASGIGDLEAAATGAAAGLGTATAVGSALAPGTGASAGTGTAGAAGLETSTGAAASAGTGTAAGVGRAASIAAGAASGTGAAGAIGIDSEVSPGAAAGTGVATATGRKLATAAGVAAGVGAAAGLAIQPASIGLAAATGTASAVGVALRRGVGLASATGAASGFSFGASYRITTFGDRRDTDAAQERLISSEIQGDGLAHAISISTAFGVGVGASSSGVGSAHGTGTAAGVSRKIIQGVGLAAATGTATSVTLGGGADHRVTTYGDRRDTDAAEERLLAGALETTGAGSAQGESIVAGVSIASGDERVTVLGEIRRTLTGDRRVPIATGAGLLERVTVRDEIRRTLSGDRRVLIGSVVGVDDGLRERVTVLDEIRRTLTGDRRVLVGSISASAAAGIAQGAGTATGVGSSSNINRPIGIGSAHGVGSAAAISQLGFVHEGISVAAGIGTAIGRGFVVVPSVPVAGVQVPPRMFVPQKVTTRARNNNIIGVSPFSGGQHVKEFRGAWWEFEFQLPAMAAADGETVVAFLESLRGQVGTFEFGNPKAAKPLGAARFGAGDPRVDLPVNTPMLVGTTLGNTLAIRTSLGDVPGYLLAGDQFALGEIGNGQRSLHRVLADVDLFGGRGTLEIWPRLRMDIHDDDPLHVFNPSTIVRLASSAVQHDVDESGIYYFNSIAVIEALVNKPRLASQDPTNPHTGTGRAFGAEAIANGIGTHVP